MINTVGLSLLQCERKNDIGMSDDFCTEIIDSRALSATRNDRMERTKPIKRKKKKEEREEKNGEREREREREREMINSIILLLFY